MDLLWKCPQRWRHNSEKNHPIGNIKTPSCSVSIQGLFSCWHFYFYVKVTKRPQ